MAPTQTKSKIKSSRGFDNLAGKWAAFVDGEAVDSAATLPALMEKIRRRKFASKPSVMLVPRKDEGPYILIFL